MRNLKRVLLSAVVLVAFSTIVSARGNESSCCEAKDLLYKNFKKELVKEGTFSLMNPGESEDIVIVGKVDSDNTFKVARVMSENNVLNAHIMSLDKSLPAWKLSSLQGQDIAFKLKLVRN